jgi:phosphoribosylanthranilate isomerase
MRASVKVKICGITRSEDLIHAVDAGADAVGFVVGVPSSPRNIPIEHARKLVSQVPIFTKSVLVMVPRSLEEIIEIYEMVNPDAIQIHGDFLTNTKIDELKKIGAKQIQAIKIKSNEFVEPLSTQGFDTILLDTYVPGKFGGTGVTQNWEFCCKIRKTIHPKKLILAGGLTPLNVKKAIQVVEPYAVDVSTGVESSPGIKDPKKVEAFIERVKGLKP